MKDKSEFYYLLSQSALNFTRNPQGAPDIQRLIDNKPFWHAPTLPTVTIQKSLVLADWTASHWTPEKIKMVKKLNQSYLKKNFLIWFRATQHQR